MAAVALSDTPKRLLVKTVAGSDIRICEELELFDDEAKERVV